MAFVGYLEVIERGEVRNLCSTETTLQAVSNM